MKILYLFTGGRERRLGEIRGGKAPSEFLFGAYYMIQQGYHVDIMEMESIERGRLILDFYHTIRSRIVKKVTNLAVDSTVFETAVTQMNNYDHIVCGNDFVALSLFAQAKKGKLITPFSFFAMGQLSNTFSRKVSKFGRYLGRKEYGRLIEKSASAVFLGRGEYQTAIRTYPALRQKLFFLPFFVDTEFWKPLVDNSPDEYIFSIGNDRHRDWEMALDVARHMPERKFKFVTKNTFLGKNCLPGNVALIRGDWKDALLSDIEVRELYQKAQLVILPIKETSQPSGQSACLQAMACGKPVIISDYSGLWDRGNMVDGVHYKLSSHTSNDFIEHINSLLNDDKARSKIGKSARALIETTYNAETFASRVKEIIRLH